MVLVDTSVWIDHFRSTENRLVTLLEDEEVVIHPLIIGELACGNLKNRKQLLYLLHDLPAVNVVEDEELLQFIENRQLYGCGVGLIDIHLLASAILDAVPLWTMDNKLRKIARKLSVVH